MEKPSPKATAVILAGGLGTRFGAKRPKQLVKIAGKSILSHTLDAVANATAINNVVVVANPVWHETIHSIVTSVNLRHPVRMVDGGESRNESVWNAICSGPSSVDPALIVHDSVRPLATPRLMDSIALGLADFDAVVPMIPSADPLFIRYSASSTVSSRQ